MPPMLLEAYYQIVGDLVLTFLVGVAASTISGIAGGGGGLISAPYFILLGLPPQVAVATTKFGALGLIIGSLTKFRKTEHIRREHLFYLAILSVAAALVGSQLLLATNNAVLEKLVGLMMLVAIPFLFINKVGLERVEASRLRESIGYILYFAVLVLQAAFGAGVGMLVMIIMMGLFGFTALESSATRRVPGLILAATALAIYMFNDIVYYEHGLAMLGGMLVGGYLGTHIAIKKGNAFVKGAFAVIVAALALRLLVG